MIEVVKTLKIHVRNLLCLGIPNPGASLIIEINAYDIETQAYYIVLLQSNKAL